MRAFNIKYAESKDRQQNPEAIQNEEDIVRAGQSTLFTPPSPSHKDAPYQRITCLTPISSTNDVDRRLGAASTGFATPNEIVIFDTRRLPPTESELRKRIELDKDTEAVDMDLTEHSNGLYSLTYCTDRHVFVYEFNYDHQTSRFEALFDTPSRIFSNATDKCRSVRWLGPRQILLLLNSSGKGAELVTLCIDDPHDKALAGASRKLPRSIQSGVGLDICALDADPVTNRRQIVVAVAGKNASIHLFSVDHQLTEGEARKHTSGLKPFTVLKNVHSVAISNVVLGPFIPPQQPRKSNMSVAGAPQYLQLASTSLDGSVVVNSLPLTSTPVCPSLTPDAPGRKKSPMVRWVLSTSGAERLRSWPGLLFLSFLALLASILLQKYLSGYTRGDSSAVLSNIQDYPEFSGPKKASAPPSDHQEVLTRVETASAKASEPHSQSSLSQDEPRGNALPSEAPIIARTHDMRGLLRLNKPVQESPDGSQAPGASRIVVRPNAENQHLIAASLHEDHAPEALEKEGLRKFEDINQADKDRWKAKLARAGQWAEDEGEEVLLGVFFSEYAAVVGGFVRDAILDH